MNIIFYSTNKNNYFTDSMKEKVEKKIAKIEKYLQKEDHVKMTLDTDKNHLITLKCQVVLKDNYHLFLQTSSFDFTNAVNDLFSKLKEETLSHFEQVNNRKFDKKQDYDQHIENDDLIKKEKNAYLEVLDDYEAIQKLEDTGYNFYLYQDESKNVCAVYRRFDNTYGKINTKTL